MKKIFIFVFSAVVLCSFAAPKPQQDAELFEAKEKKILSKNLENKAK